MFTEAGITKNQIISELSRSPHGKLNEYVPVCLAAAEQEPEFLAHLIVWDNLKGQIRDAKVALPVISLAVPDYPDELAENSLAHLALLNPRELLRAYRFALSLRTASSIKVQDKSGWRLATKQVPVAAMSPKMRKLRRLVEAYLRGLESNPNHFTKTAVIHHAVLKELYALTHLKPSGFADRILFKGERPRGSVFEAIAQLKNMSPAEAAGTILEYKLPFLVIQGALGKKLKDRDIVMAMISRMSPTELVTNVKMLERLGMKNDPVLRAAFASAMERASKSTKNTLKTTRAAEAIQDTELKSKLQGLQERQIEALGGVEGNWLVLGDKSGSMSAAIELARHVAATLAKMVKGRVHLAFFDTAPQTIEVTGKPLDEIKAMTRYVRAGGGTSIGCGLQRMLDSGVMVDGIAIISDGGENSAPRFPDVYKRYVTFVGKDVPVYLYQCLGDPPTVIQAMQEASLDLQVIDVMKGVDYYSLPNIVATMRTNRYSLYDEVMATKLLTVDEVLKPAKGE
jgi:hypothetical protein